MHLLKISHFIWSYNYLTIAFTLDAKAQNRFLNVYEMTLKGNEKVQN